MSNILLKNQTTGVSDPIKLASNDGGLFVFDLLVYGTLGDGTVTVSILNSEGTYVDFADMIITETGAYTFKMRSKDIRISIDGATDVNVEVVL